jgi:flavin reductase (DIM6/NTAB) family NADH-FMN oxidoreductase RutF
VIETTWSEAIKRKYPEPVVLVVSCDREGRPDVMPAGWSMVTSGIPPMLAVSIGHRRYTHKLIEETGEFVLVFPSEGMAGLINYTGSRSGRDVDKFSEYGIETLRSKYVKPPLIKGAVACFECKVRGKLVTGDHTVFVGEVMASYVSEKYKDRLYNFGNNRFRTIPEE